MIWLRRFGAGLVALLRRRQVENEAFSRVLVNQLGNMSRTDPAASVMVAVTVLAVGLAACFLPAYRATRVDPLVALRHE